MTELVQVPGLVWTHPLVVGWVTDPSPNDDDVKAGWTAFVIFLLLIAATALICFSFVRQMRKVEAAKKAGVFGPDDAESPGGETADEPEPSAPR